MPTMNDPVEAYRDEAKMRELAGRIEEDLRAGRVPASLIIEPIPMLKKDLPENERDALNKKIRHVKDARLAYWKTRLDALIRRAPAFGDTPRVFRQLAQDLATNTQEPAALMPQLDRSRPIANLTPTEDKIWGESEYARKLLGEDMPNLLRAAWEGINIDVPAFNLQDKAAMFKTGRIWAVAAAVRFQQWLYKKILQYDGIFYPWPQYSSCNNSLSPFPTNKRNGDIRLEMTLPRHLSLVLAPNHRSLERSNDGRRTTLHGFPGKLSDESFGSPSQQTTYYYALCGRDLYTVLWLDAAERIADALADAAHAADFQTCTTMNTYQRSDAEIDAALALLPPELRRLTPHTCAPAVVRLLEEKRKPPPVPGYRANPASANSDLIRQLAEEAIERARNGAAFVIRKLPPDTVPDLQPDGGIDVSLDLETLAQKEPAALWISSLLLLRHNGRWHSLEHEFFDCPGLVTRQRLYLQPPEDAQFDAAQWQRACNSLSFIESGDGLGIDWVGLMFLED